MSKNHKHTNNNHQNTSARKILVAFLLNFGFSIFEFFGGLFTNSIAIASDAIHDFGDAISIGIAYALERYSRKAPDGQHTYGYVRYSVIGSLITTVILLAGSCLVIVGAIQRLFHPVPVDYSGMLIFAIFGVVINFIAAYYTHSGDSLNQKSVNLHMLEDVLGWVVVLIGAIIMHFTNIDALDAILSIAVASFILVHAFGNFKTILDLFLEKTPAGVSVDELRQAILSVRGVQDVHHIHLWSLDGYQNYATLHAVCARPNSTLKADIRQKLLECCNVAHVTIELEVPRETCPAKYCCPVSSSAPHRH